MCSHCAHFQTRIAAGEITAVSLTKGRVDGAYSIYGYRCYRVAFSDGSSLSTSSWMYPDSAASRKHLEKAFGILATDAAP